ncbi:MAG: hypothetical protein L6R30_18170 [Thermoanaerobaculia bacterium]|nr:hypothetical protein [Thermoanaerobaculia bacterium]
MDVFVEHPIPFEEVWERSVIVPVGGTGVRIASIEDIVRMKTLAGRPKDFEDIAALERIRARKSELQGG